jgi:uncharacterized protein YjeT (DUF2065 family)
MDIVLLSLGLILVIIGFPFCFSCQIQAFWKKMSRAKASQTNQQSYQNIKRNRSIGLFSMIVGVLLIVLSLSGVSFIDNILAMGHSSAYTLLFHLVL